MIPAGSMDAWFVFAILLCLAYIAVALINLSLDEPRAPVWLGSTVGEILTRAAVVIPMMVFLRLNYAICTDSCNPWLNLTTFLLCGFALIGWPWAALWMAVAYLVGNTVWGSALGLSSGIAANFFQLLVFLISLFVVFLQLRERVPRLAAIALPAAWEDLAERSQRAIRAMRTPPPPVLPLSKPATADTKRASSPVTGTGYLAPPSAGIAAGGLYLLTLFVEGASALVRSGVIFLLSLFVLSPLYLVLFAVRRDQYWGEQVDMWGAQTGQMGVDVGAWLWDTLLLCLTISALVGLGLGFWPLLRSLFHVLFPYTRSGAGVDEREALGARTPTRAEHQKIIDALQVIQAATPAQVAAPSSWLVIDAPTPDAYTLGSTVYLARAAIDDSNLVGIMAHELGHVAHQDGDLVLALRRLIIPMAY